MFSFTVTTVSSVSTLNVTLKYSSNKAINVISFVTKVLKSYNSSPKYQPLNSYSSITGSVGLETLVFSLTITVVSYWSTLNVTLKY